MSQNILSLRGRFSDASWKTILLLIALTFSGSIVSAKDLAPAEKEPARPKSEQINEDNEDPDVNNSVQPDGLIVNPRDGLGYKIDGWTFQLRGTLALDYREYDSRNTRDTGYELDRALIGADLRHETLGDLRLIADPKGIDTRYAIDEGWYSKNFLSNLVRVTVGLQKFSIGVEHSLREQQLAFVDYSFPAFLSGRNDLGVQLDGEVLGGLLSYNVGFGLGEGYDLTGTRASGRILTAKLVSYPLRWLQETELAFLSPFLGGLFVSAGYSHNFDPERDLEIATSLRNKLFTTPRLKGDYETYRQLGAGADAGPIRVICEVVQGSYGDLLFPNGATQDLDNHLTAWSVSVSCFITGEKYDSRPFHQRYRRTQVPNNPIVDENGDFHFSPGAIEIAARYSHADIDRKIVNGGFVTQQIVSEEFRTVDLAVNWYPIAVLKLGFQITRTFADSDPQTFQSEGNDTSYLFRCQLDF